MYTDAIKSMQIFNLYCRAQNDAAELQVTISPQKKHIYTYIHMYIYIHTCYIL